MESKDAKDLIAEALKRFKACVDREYENWERAKEAIRFRALEQWPDAVKREREDPKQEGGPQPCPVLDKTNQYVRQVVNEERLNKPAIKPRPVDDKADVKVANVFSGLIRHIEDASDADVAYTTGGEHAIDGGFGYWRILTEYCDPRSFDQDIRIKRVPNRFSVLLGPHQEPDGSDAKYGFIYEDMDKEEFERTYPGKEMLDFDTAEYPDWANDEKVRIAEYFRIEYRKETLLLLEDGTVVEKSQRQPGDTLRVMKERETQIPTVKWYKLTASDVLEDRDLVGEFIPIVKVIGNELIMPDGKCRLSGMLETMMDPQRLHNYASAGFITHVALAPRAPWVAAEGQTEDYIDDWVNANRKNIALLRYTPIDNDTGQPIPAPQRTQPAGVPPGWQQLLMNTEHAIEAAVGMYGPSVGGPARERSGVALDTQKEQGAVGNFHFPQNLARSIRHTGRILLQWIPKYYDTQRIARIIGEDGVADMAYLNPEQDTAVADRKDDMGRYQGESYNLNVGKYDVTISVGPSWSTKRQEGAEMMTQAMQANPGLAPIIGDLYFKSLDVPYADQIAERLKAMLPPQIQKLETNKDKKPLDPKVQALMDQIEQQAQMLEERAQALQQAEQQLQVEAQKVGADKSELESMRTKLDAERKVFMADAARVKAEIELKGKQIAEGLQPLQQAAVERENSEEQEFAVAAQLANLANSMEQTVSLLQQNAQMLTNIASHQLRPKRATLSDGRTISIEALPDGPMQ